MVPVKAAYFTTEINENTEKINRRRRTMDPPQCHSGRSVTETRNPVRNLNSFDPAIGGTQGRLQTSNLKHLTHGFRIITPSVFAEASVVAFGFDVINRRDKQARFPE
jgi:hypothetical protein